jgi:UDP-N-acetylglucosamine 2-epimerase (non-hydrolysing)
MKIMVIGGARPNFVKISPILKVLRQQPDHFSPIFVHTGQHYDTRMSQSFLDDLEIGPPDIALAVGSGSHAVQTARIMEAFEPVVVNEKPDVVLVVGDVTSTMACTIVCAKLMIPVVHVEAGIRSFDRSMPEEINRIVTDALADLFLVPVAEARENLIREGIHDEKIHFVGNVMIDTLVQCREHIDNSNIVTDLGLTSQEYTLLTLHRVSNVDDEEALKNIVYALGEIGKHIRIVFSVHPRTQKMLTQFGLLTRVEAIPGLINVEPLPYFDFLKLQRHARFVLTDSGGIQEETTFLGIPCLTLRENTERPITITRGTNKLIGTDSRVILQETKRILDNQWQRGQIPDLWDGHTAERIADILRQTY